MCDSYWERRQWNSVECERIWEDERERETETKERSFHHFSLSDARWLACELVKQFFDLSCGTCVKKENIQELTIEGCQKSSILSLYVFTHAPFVLKRFNNFFFVLFLCKAVSGKEVGVASLSLSLLFTLHCWLTDVWLLLGFLSLTSNVIANAKYMIFAGRKWWRQRNVRLCWWTFKWSSFFCLIRMYFMLFVRMARLTSSQMRNSGSE